MQDLPILYSFRRCPYAIRARMTLAYAKIQCELREVFLKQKPSSMLRASAKGTVPVLVLADGRVIDESSDIMRWALSRQDQDQWWLEGLEQESGELLKENDFSFKVHLDHYKYWERFPQKPRQHYREQAEVFLEKLERLLSRNNHLLDDQLRFADIAVFPFVRQFAFADLGWFEQSPYPKLRNWLSGLLKSPLFLDVMKKHPPWQEGDARALLLHGQSM